MAAQRGHAAHAALQLKDATCSISRRGHDARGRIAFVRGHEHVEDGVAVELKGSDVARVHAVRPGAPELDPP